MTDEPRDGELEDRLDEAFGSMRPRAGFEAELWERIGSAPVALPLPRTSQWWTWAGAAAAVLLIGAVAFLFTHLPAARTGGSSAAGRSAFSAGAPDAAFGPLPRPSPSASPVDKAFAPVAPLTALQAGASTAPALPATAVVIRYREPSADDQARLAASLGASGSGARYSNPEFTLTFFPTDPALGLPAHFVLTVLAATGPPPAAPPSDAAAVAAAQAFTNRRRIPAAGAVVRVSREGPLAVVRYDSGMDVYVRGDGTVAQLSAPSAAAIERSTYRLATPDQLRAQAHAPAGIPARLETVLVLADGYAYYEPVAVFGTFSVPAIEPSSLR